MTIRQLPAFRPLPSRARKRHAQLALTELELHAADNFCDMEDIILDPFLAAAIEEAQTGLLEGGIPIGSVIVHDSHIIGRGHNRRVQRGSTILHGEMDALENAGRQDASVYRQCTLYTTLSPCPMCSGAIALYEIPRVVIGENHNFVGNEELLRSRGVELEIVNDPACIEMMRTFIADHPQLWNEDIGATEG